MVSLFLNIIPDNMLIEFKDSCVFLRRKTYTSFSCPVKENQTSGETGREALQLHSW